LDDEEGNVFMATSAGYYPIGVVGRRNAVGDLFVSGVVALPLGDFTTAVEEIRKSGVELILGTEAKELLCKMQQVEGFAMPAAKSKEIWEVEDWGEDEWAEQFLAEVAFSMAMNVQHVPDHNKIGHVVGYRVRRAPNGLVLVPSDNDEDIFVAVKRETTKPTKGGLAYCSWVGCVDRRVSFPNAIRTIAGSFPQRPCTIWKSFLERNGSKQCHRFKSPPPDPLVTAWRT
jgi:hypothetical protein